MNIKWWEHGMKWQARYTHMGYETGMRENWLCKENSTDYSLGRIRQKEIDYYNSIKKSHSGAVVAEIAFSDVEVLNGNNGIWPTKNKRFMIERYAKHPVYNYGIWEVKKLSRKAYVIWRLCGNQYNFCVRVVDVFGHIELVLKQE